MGVYLIGGNEDREERCEVLRGFLEAGGGDQAEVVVIPVASQNMEEAGEVYLRLFTRLGAKRVEAVAPTTRKEANQEALERLVEKAKAVFFTGGDQLRLTSLLGGTNLDRALHRAFQRGTLMGGTSAGAAAMSSTMIVAGEGEVAPQVDVVRMAPGLGFIREVIIDQHFAQRGRLGRLLAAIAYNPYILGLGIDEDTAVWVDGDRLQVLGRGTVTVVDGRGIEHTNISIAGPKPLALTGVALHVLPAGYGFNLDTRCPLPPLS
ncbi:cyanophycinase [Thermanaeromonas toyohensis ToBE]|uniref:Cyanophycinase n=1 Tax=Thermanaeromonas toyohensis ToBE TaxID=698762 RepID=A0A1W1V819_9FIRM|nr:cyanophycinase [Thermanaeromonas toyohensis]SMB89416.1 cyanophycinase [Thermanaeromonas toyohensis ToBE]